MEGPRGRRNFKQGLEAISGIGGPGHLAMQYAKAMGVHIAAVDVADELFLPGSPSTTVTAITAPFHSARENQLGRSSLMQTANTQQFCADTSKSCTGACPGYGTRTDCPPLIVLAVLSVQPTEPSARANR